VGPRVGLADGLQDGAQVGPRVDERLGLAVGRPSQARVCSYTAASKGWSSEVAQE